MPAATRTIVAPLPNDPRVMTLAKSLGLSRREAFACCCEAWAWLSVMAVDGIVGNAVPDTLDGIVDVVGFGQAMLEARLVGVADDGLVVPSELRVQRERGIGRSGADADDEDDDDRHRKSGRIRQRRCRARKALNKPAVQAVAPAAAENPSARPKPRQLGDVDGRAVMLLYRRDGVPFYAIKNALPEEWTGTVTNPSNPSLEDALVAIVSTMKRAKDGRRGRLGEIAAEFSPSMEEVVAAAKRERAKRATTAAEEARRDEANDRLAAASADDQDDIATSVTKRDSHAPVTPVTRDTVTVTLLSRPASVTSPSNSGTEADLGHRDSHAPVTLPPPSSSSVLMSSSEKEDKENTTTTTSSVTPPQRDFIDDFLDRVQDYRPPSGEEDPLERVCPWGDFDAAKRERFEKYAAALNTTLEAVAHQARYDPDVLRTRLKLVGITPGAPSKPAGGQPNGKMTTEPMEDDKPVAGILVAPAADDHDRDHDDVVTIGQAARAATSVAELANALG
jgi:hypothetical protein